VSRFQAFGPPRLEEIARKFGLGAGLRETIRLHALVLPFRVNEYVLTRLIDWRRPEDDPIFHLFFPQPGMLGPEDERELASASQSSDAERLRAVVAGIRGRLNPQPEHQLDLNVPHDAEGPIPGAQHKYRETLLYFPASGQTCHAYCTYCFRWAQFVGDPELRFAAADPARVVRYLRDRPEITDVLVTGGDPMVMSAERLRRHLEPFLDVPGLETIRVGTKSVASWPHRFLTDVDADETLRLFERIVGAGKTLAVMAHFSHPVELSTNEARAALRRIRDTGAVVYGQAPVIGRVNDDAAVWAELWRAEFRAGIVPYYMFMARDTGPRDYFRVPLARAAGIFRDAYAALPGLARTVRGPVMSATAGKIVVDGVEEDEDSGEGFFRLRFLQARDPSLVGRPFSARRSATAAWIDEVELAPGTPADIAAAVGGNSGDNSGDSTDIPPSDP
jgi:L-lysine 2,3-aminomutase